MNAAETYLKAKEIFHSVLDQPLEFRPALVSAACQGDRQLQQAVESLLQTDFTSGEQFEELLRQQIAYNATACLAISQSLTNPNDLIGQVLKERYEIKEWWQTGGMGWVYLGQDRFASTTATATVVIKVLQPSSLLPWALSHFRQEAQALRRLNHPGVVNLLDEGVTAQGLTFLVMEFIDGLPLANELVSGKRLAGGLPRAARLIRQLSEAIAAAHDKGIYHRDLSPHNVLLQHCNTSWETVKVIDFGIATVKQLYDEKTKFTMSVSGKPAYMAPEQLDGQPGKESDIYALGVIAYQMLTGCTPFQPDPHKGEGFIQLKAFFGKLQREEIQIPNPHDYNPLVSPRAGKVVLRALAYEPTQRYHSAAQFGETLAAELLPLNLWKTSSFVRRTATNQTEWSSWIVRIAISLVMMTIWSIGHWALDLRAMLKKLVFEPVSVKDTSSFPRSSVQLPEPVAPDLLRFSYYFIVENLPGKPRLVTGKERVFKLGDKIRLHITAETAGYLYVINQASILPNQPPDFALLFPKLEEQHYFKPQQEYLVPGLASKGFEFGGFDGNEQLWLVYARQPIPLLENLRRLVTKQKGEVRQLRAINELKILLQRSMPLVIEDDPIRRFMQVQGQENYVTVLIELPSYPVKSATVSRDPRSLETDMPAEKRRFKP
jgi:serine/threonine protein kinase